MLLDSGWTHNFISQTLVKKIQLTTESCLPIKVTVANGETISCKRKITQFGWKLAQGEFQTPMYVIPLWGYDTVLGVQWMQTVSPISLDFEKKEVLIHWKGKKVVLEDQGDPKQFYSVHITINLTGDPRRKLIFWFN